MDRESDDEYTKTMIDNWHQVRAAEYPPFMTHEQTSSSDDAVEDEPHEEGHFDVADIVWHNNVPEGGEHPTPNHSSARRVVSGFVDKVQAMSHIPPDDELRHQMNLYNNLHDPNHKHYDHAAVVRMRRDLPDPDSNVTPVWSTDETYG